MPTTIDDHSDLPGRSDDELHDILLHIDPAQAPARYRAVRDEYARRHGSTMHGRSFEDYFERARRKRAFSNHSQLKKRVLIALALWGLAMLLVRAVLYVRTHR
jgi:hypothetical protein